ncbi:fibronectin type III domain-containing protein [Streptomyces sp. NPDC059037]|uniref:fibronectin type III domain-containing protein n=1 Tax=Streptomyces sp. NPDC059037 TaxID=3346710 RepID=UPI0036859AB6
MRRTPHLTALIAVIAACALSSCAWQDDPSESKDAAPPAAPRGVTVQSGSATTAHVMWNRATDDTGVTGYDVYRGATRVERVPGGTHMVDVTGLRPSTTYTFTVRARDAADNFSPASRAVRLTTAPGRDDGRGTAPTDFRATTHRAGGAYYIDLSWTPPRTGGAVSEYQIHLDGKAATSLVFGGTAPRTEATHSFYVGKEPGERHRVKLRARLPDGTWGGCSAERTVTTGRPS